MGLIFHVVMLIIVCGIPPSTQYLEDDDLSTCCRESDKQLVQKQWNAVWLQPESSKHKILFARTILFNVIYFYPELLDFFDNVQINRPSGGVFSAHCMRIANAFDMIISMLDNEEVLNEALAHLARQHAARVGVRVRHMEAFGQIVNLALTQLLDDYDTMAWKSCWKGILKRLSEGLPQ